MNAQATRLNGRLEKATAKGNTAQAKKLGAKLNNVNSRINANTTSLSRLNSIRNDQKHPYTFNQLPQGSKIGGTVLGIGKNSEGKEKLAIVMNIASDANAVHELTHAYQGGIEQSIKITPDGAAFPGSSLFSQRMLDAKSEIEAYQAQYGFDESTLPSSKYGGTPQNMDAINIPYVGGLYDNKKPVYPNVQDLLLQLLLPY